MSDIGIVVIGRNEGERLRSVLRSAHDTGVPVVYSDSDSTDGSPDVARAEGAVVTVIRGGAMSAARGRNQGLETLCESHPGVRFVQFVDGDTVLDPAWISSAASALAADADVAAVCGHLAEHDAESSMFRRLVQIEWRGPVGDIAACGGNAMYRRDAFDAAGRFRASLVGGEEAELCGRLRSRGLRIRRLDLPMGVHDSRIDSFGRWWRRAVRVGQSLAALRDDVPGYEPPGSRHVFRSAFVWGVALPLGLAVGVPAPIIDVRLAVLPVALAAVLVVQILRIQFRAVASGLSGGDALLYALFCMVAKTAYVYGWVRHRLRRSPNPSAASPAGSVQRRNS